MMVVDALGIFEIGLVMRVDLKRIDDGMSGGRIDVVYGWLWCGSGEMEEQRDRGGEGCGRRARTLLGVSVYIQERGGRG